MSGIAKEAILTLKPKSEIIHAVTVVPTLAPIITAIDWLSESKPAFTKLTIITVVADELCTKAVMKIPVNAPTIRLLVIMANIFLNLSPAAF